MFFMCCAVAALRCAVQEELEVDSSGDSSASSASSLNSLDKASQEQEGSAGQQQPGGGAGPAAPGSAPAYNHQQQHHHHHGRPHVRHRWPRALRVLAALAQASAFLVVRAVLRLASPAMVLLLRRLVRSRRCVLCERACEECACMCVWVPGRKRWHRWDSTGNVGEVA